MAAATGAPVEVDDGWMETDFGEWEGLSFAEAMERWPDEVAAWLKDTSVPPPGGETFDATGHRVLAALDRLLAAGPAGTVVVVSHVTPMKTVLRHALLAPPESLRRMFLSVACLCEVDWYADGPGGGPDAQRHRAPAPGLTAEPGGRPLCCGARRASRPGGRAGTASRGPGEEGPGSAGQGGR